MPAPTLYKWNGTIIRTATGELARSEFCCCDGFPPPGSFDCEEGTACKAWGEWDGSQWVYRADLSDCPADPGRGGPGPCENTYIPIPLVHPDPGEYIGQLRCFPCITDVPP